MKKYTFIFVLMLAVIHLKAQDEMSEIYKMEIDHSFDFTAYGNEDGYSYASSAKEITVFNNKSGKVLWNKKYNAISDQLGKVDDVDRKSVV